MVSDWISISQEISRVMADTGFRVYVSIADIYGNMKYMDGTLEPFEAIIKGSIISNIDFIDIGQYTIPISSKNMMIFKISEKAIVILYAEKGNIAQLLSFKKNIKFFSEQIDNLIGELSLPTEPSEVVPAPAAVKVTKPPPQQIFGKELPSYHPFLDKKLDDKFRATVEEIAILQLCDGHHSFPDIIEQTNQPRNDVFEYLNKQMKKKILRSDATPLLIECPDCKSEHHLFLPNTVLQTSEEPLKLLIRSDLCNHEYVAFITKKAKFETQSLHYFTDFQKDKFMKRLGEHYYTILS